jgi:hypothetical protein
MFEGNIENENSRSMRRKTDIAAGAFPRYYNCSEIVDDLEKLTVF